MLLVNTTSAINIIEWSGVASSLTGSLLNAQGQRSGFVFWTISAVLMGVVALYLTDQAGWHFRQPESPSTFTGCGTGSETRLEDVFPGKVTNVLLNCKSHKRLR